MGFQDLHYVFSVPGLDYCVELGVFDGVVLEKPMMVDLDCIATSFVNYPADALEYSWLIVDFACTHTRWPSRTSPRIMTEEKIRQSILPPQITVATVFPTSLFWRLARAGTPAALDNPLAKR